MPRLALVLILTMAALASVAATGTGGPRREGDELRTRRVEALGAIRGMTISCHGSGRSWGSDAMVASMEQLAALGVNWVAIHPYAGIAPDGTVGGRRLERMDGDTSWLTRPIREAHRLGLRIMIKPHIAYWGSPFEWRGAIRFDDDASWERFFRTYETWITHVATVCHDADAFVVGTELDATVGHEAPWRRIIAAVRARTEAPLVYSANWDRYERIPFWDALDLIGIQAYFPLVDHAGVPEESELDAAWSAWLARIDRFARREDRSVVFGELGYNRSHLAAHRPWEYRTGGAEAELVQRRCLDAALAALEVPSRVRGAFLWKWFPGEQGRGNFLMHEDGPKAAIRAAWGEGARRGAGSSDAAAGGAGASPG